MNTNANFYQLIAENTADVIYVLNSHGLVTYVTPSIQKMLGYTQEQCLGKHILEFPVTASSRSMVREMFDQLEMGELSEFVIDVGCVASTGAVVWTEQCGQVVRSESGDPEFFCIVSRDITAFRQAQTALVESEEQYRRLAERSIDPILTYDADGKLTYASPGAEIFWRIPTDQLLGAHYTLQMSVESKQMAEEVFRRLQNGLEISDSIEVLLHLAGGNDVWVDARIWPIYSSDSDFEGFQLMLRDITRRKRDIRILEDQRSRLTQHAQELIRLNAQLDDFSSTVSHDLSGPLRRILVYLESVDPKEAHSARSLKEAKQEASELTLLVEHLLDVSRTNHAQIERDDVDLGILFSLAVSRLVVSTGRSCVALGPKEREVVAFAEPILVRMVINNLVENAFKYTPRTRALSLVFERITEGGEEIYSLRDNGSGFPLDRIPHLFSRHVRGGHPVDISGHGIGLSTVANAITQHNGRIWVINVPSGGAQVNFTLGPDTAG